jgi:DNA relaxase NicK
MRVYDKGRESGLPEYENCIRYEIELKGSKSKLTANTLYDAFIESGKSQDILARRIVSTIIAESRKRAMKMEDFSDLQPIEITGERKQTDIDASLKWLETQVRPKVMKLIKKGLANEVFTALGLNDPSILIHYDD